MTICLRLSVCPTQTYFSTSMVCKRRVFQRARQMLLRRVATLATATIPMPGTTEHGPSPQ